MMDFFKTFNKTDAKVIAEALHGVSVPITYADNCIRCGTQTEADEHDRCKTCGAPLIPEDLRIPKWLVISEDVRRKAWEGFQITDAYRGGKVEEWKQREAERRAAVAAVEREKKAKSLAKLKAKHEGERYDRKKREWVKVREDGEPKHSPEELDGGPGVWSGDGQQET